MPKPSKRPAKDDSSDSDSGPEDRTPVNKGKGAGTSSAAKKPKGNPAVEGEEPTWELGQNKKVKVGWMDVLLLSKSRIAEVCRLLFPPYDLYFFSSFL